MTNDSSQMHTPLRVAILGYGLAGAVFHAPLVATTPGMTVAGIVTSAPERQARARRDYPNATIFASADDLWPHAEQFDLVVIATPNRAHLPLGLAALDAKLPIVIDKPVTPSAADAERLIAAARQAGKLFTVFQNRRWDNDFLTLRQLLAADVLGPITRFESRFERYRPEVAPDAWREFAAPEEAGGLLFDLGAHLIDQAMVLFGAPLRVYAEVDRRRHGAQVDDDTFVALECAGGVRAHLWMSVTAPRLAPRYRLSGLRGAYEKDGLDPQEAALQAGMRPGDPAWGHEPRERWGRLTTMIGGMRVEGTVETQPGAYEQFYALVRDALVSGGPAPVDPSEALAALRVIEAARESARTGTVVSLA